MTEPTSRELLERISLRIVAQFAEMQADVTEALEAHLESRLAEPIHRLVWRRTGRMSDDELKTAALALARVSGQRLDATVFADTYNAVKGVRDTIAHVGRMLPGNDPTTGEPVLLSMGGRKRKFETFSRARLDGVAIRAYWLAAVAGRLRFRVAGEEWPKRFPEPSDVPRSAFVGWVTDLDDWPAAPSECANGHSDVRAATTSFGRAWVCAQCTTARLLDLPDPPSRRG